MRFSENDTIKYSINIEDVTCKKCLKKYKEKENK